MKNINEVARRVELAEANQSVDLSDVSSISYVTFDLSEEGYCWIAKLKNSPHNIQPLASAWKVKTFRTLTGAKRNFLRRMKK